jgi:hypothetical protein
VRRIIKSPSDTDISDNLIIDYINRFWLMDVDARIQLFDLKTTYQFQTTPGIDKYNMPLYQIQTEPGGQAIASYPVYQGFMAPARINGVNVPFYTSRQDFYNIGPTYTSSLSQAALGDGTAGPYNFNLTSFPVLPGHVDINGIITNGSAIDPILGNTLAPVLTTSVKSCVYFTASDINGQNVVVADSGQFLSTTGNGDLYGLLMSPGPAPFGNASLGVYDINTNTINYMTGEANVLFPVAIPAGNPIQFQCYFVQSGLPRAILYYNNVITLFNPPNTQYLVEMDAYLSPAAFLSTGQALPFGYMAEYIARGAARKILSDTGDIEQFQFYEGLFREQEMLVWKRSQRQVTANRTQTIYSSPGFQGGYNQNSMGI